MVRFSNMSATSTTTTATATASFEEQEFFDPSYGRFAQVPSCKEGHEDYSSATFWEMAMSLYLPVLLLWLRRSMFGTANLVRSLILGHCLRLLFGNMSEWITKRSPWLRPFLVHTGKQGDPHAWPPPALTALAILTVMTLIVHPDGFTWIMLGKLRLVILDMIG